MSNKPKVILVSAACLTILACVALRSIRVRSYEAANRCISNLRMIDAGKGGWADKYHKGTNDVPTLQDLQPILLPGRKDEPLVFMCPKGGTYTIGPVGEAPRCSIGGPSHTLP